MHRLNKHFFILISILILAGFLRLYNIEKRPLYGDEFASLKWSSLSIKEYMAIGALRGDEKPLYYIILHFWRKYISDSKAGMRYLSVIAGVLSIVMIFIFTRRFINPQVGLLSAFLLAISPMHIYYAQEIRMYTMQSLFVLISFYLFLNFFSQRDKTKIYRVGYILSIVVAIHLHISALLAILAQNIYYLFRRRDASLSIRHWILTQLFILLLTPQVIIPIFFIFGYKYGNWANYVPSMIEIYKTFPIMDLPKTYCNFSIGFLVREIEGNLSIILPAFLLFGSVFLLGIRSILNCWREKGYLLLLWCFLPVFTLFFLFVFLKNPFQYRSRYVLMASFAYYIILSMGIEGLKSRFIRISLISGISLFSFFSLYEYYTHFIRFT